ncbi:Exosome complex component RRP43 [Halotydeus destructor]|nr:Exosome complex component RRP43 [Halotydeus destructor]
MAALAFKTLQLKQYHQLFLNQDTRADGRRFDQFRDVLLSRNTIETADGSCLVKVGNTTVVAGLSATLTELNRDTEASGQLEILVELPPICCNQKFRENKQGTNEESQLAGREIELIIKQSECFDLKQLTIDEVDFVWNIQLQIICLDYDGNFGDAALIAALGALNCGSVPEVKAASGEKFSIDQVEFLSERRPLTLSCIPIASTFGIFDNDVVLADPNYEEEQLASGLATITWDVESDSLIAVHKHGGSGLSDEQLDLLFKMAKARSKQLLNILVTKTK